MLILSFVSFPRLLITQYGFQWELFKYYTHIVCTLCIMTSIEIDVIAFNYASVYFLSNHKFIIMVYDFGCEIENNTFISLSVVTQNWCTMHADWPASSITTLIHSLKSNAMHCITMSRATIGCTLLTNLSRIIRIN